MNTKISVQNHYYLTIISLLSIAILIAGCVKPTQVESIKSVRTVIVERKLHNAPIVMTGQIEARTYVSASFRTSGKIVERMVEIGDVVKAGQPLARLDSQIENDSLAAAEAELTTARAVLEQTTRVEKRAGILVELKAISQNDYDDAVRQLKSAQAQVQGAKAKLRIAQKQMHFTLLKAEKGGVITEKDAEVGEVISAGQPVVRIADTKAINAVFDMSEDIIRRGLTMGLRLRICLDVDRNICVHGTVYEIAPQADQVTRTYRVKATLKNVQPQMLLGATIIGTFRLPEEPSIQIPASALTVFDGQPAVWIVASTTNTVDSKSLKVERYTADTVIVSDGLQSGDIVVTAGVQSLHQNQKVKLQEADHAKS